MKVYQVQHLVNDQVRSQFCALKSDAKILARDLDGEVIEVLVGEQGREQLCDFLNALCTRAELVGESRHPVGPVEFEPEEGEPDYVEPEPDENFRSWGCYAPNTEGVMVCLAQTSASDMETAKRNLHHFHIHNEGAEIRPL